MVLRRALALAGGCLLACGAGCGGAGVTPGDTYASPLQKPFWGALLASPAVPTDAKPVLGILWSDPFQQRPDVLMPRDWFRTELSQDNLVSGFYTTFYRPPPPATIVRIDAPGGGDFAEIALADVVLVDDRDGDGDLRPSGIHAEVGPDDIYLAAIGQALIYVARPFSGTVAPDFPLGPLRTPGYAIIDFGCNGQVSKKNGVTEVATFVFIAQPSHRLPEVRNCRRTHSP
jgi:hypothetical protein